MTDELVQLAEESAGAASGQTLRTDAGSLLTLVSDIARERDLYFDSVLQVGCARPLDGWFAKFARGEAPRRYVGIDRDEATVERLRERGLLAYDSFRIPFDATSDLVMLTDMLELLDARHVGAWLKNAAAACLKVLAVSTINASYWRRDGVYRNFGHIQWVPKAALRCHLGETHPARIRNLMNAESLREQLGAALPEETWQLSVYEGWPWEIREVETGKSERLYLGAFAIAVRAES